MLPSLPPARVGAPRPWDQWLQRYCGLLLPVGVAAVYTAYLLLGERYDGACRMHYYDAGDYMRLSQQFRGPTGSFDLLAFPSALRGYLWPLILSVIHPPARALPPEPLAGFVLIAAFRPLGVLLAAAIFGVAGPLLWTRLHGPAPGWRRQVVFAALGFVFWRDHFHFAMADMPGVLALLLALAVVVGRRPSVVAAGAAGALAAAAVNIRPVFLLGAGALVVGAAWLWWRDGTLRPGRRGALLAALAGGILLVLVPQGRINQRQYRQPTPLVLGWMDTSRPRSLYLNHLSWGLRMQKLGASVALHLDGKMIYEDPAGRAIIQRAGLPVHDPVFPSYGAYLRAVAPHWPDALLIYARHVFNGLDIRQPSPVIRPFNYLTLVVAGLNYSVLFAALLVLLCRRPVLDRRRTAVVLAALLLPCAAVLPTAIEVRFLLPLHLLLYGVVAFGWPAHWTPRYVRGLPHRAAWLVAYGGFVLGCFMLSASAQAHLLEWPALLAP